MATKKDKTDEKKDIAQGILAKALEDDNKHFNNIVPQDYTVSTGSLEMDTKMGGGIRPAIIRLGGISELGKTSFSLNVVKNFLDEKNRRGVYFLSDKELSHEILARSGVKFVEDVDEWVDGTCFIIRTNVYEMVCNTIKKLIQPRDKTYAFVLDSMDNFAPQSALEVDFGESFAKGGTGAISSHFFRCFNILLPRLGHLTLMISQARDSIVIGRQANPTFKQMNSAGGRAIEHAVSWALEFVPAMNSKEDMFWEGEPWKSKKLGHVCVIQFKKSTNEKTGEKVRIPILYGRTAGNSIWKEYEVYRELVKWGLVTVKSSWFSFAPEAAKELKDVKIDFMEKIQGEPAFLKYLEENASLTEYYHTRFKNILSKLSQPKQSSKIANDASF